MTEVEYPIYGEITGPIIMIGFGSIGRGTLPLIERHFKFDLSRLVVIDPRTDIADYLGMTIETVSRLLSKLKQKGTIRLPTLRTVEIVNWFALRAAAV